MNGPKSETFAKGVGADKGNAVREGDSGQTATGKRLIANGSDAVGEGDACLLYTSPSPRDA